MVAKSSAGPAVAGSSSPYSSGEARRALLLLLSINLFNYIDRYVLAAVVPDIRRAFFSDNTPLDSVPAEGLASSFLHWFQTSFGFKPENALIGTLSMAFMVMYMVAAPIFGRLAERNSRWLLCGIGVLL